MRSGVSYAHASGQDLPLFRMLNQSLIAMPYQILCNDVQREGVKASPDLVSGLFCYAPLHNIWYGIGPGRSAWFVILLVSSAAFV